MATLAALYLASYRDVAFILGVNVYSFSSCLIAASLYFLVSSWITFWRALFPAIKGLMSLLELLSSEVLSCIVLAKRCP